MIDIIEINKKYNTFFLFVFITGWTYQQNMDLTMQHRLQSKESVNFEYRAIEINQSEEQYHEKRERNKQSLRDLLKYAKRSDMHVSETPK